MAFIYIVAGINHFRVPRLYTRLIPPYFPAPKTLNILSGTAEIVLGAALLFQQFTAYAAWGIIMLLIAIFPSNIYMLTNKKASMGLPKWALIARLPLQLVLIYWAWLYT